MICQTCKNLEAAFEAKKDQYLEAASLACYLVTKRFAAYLNVEMERARIELQDHRADCLFVIADFASSDFVSPDYAGAGAAQVPINALLRRPQQELLRRPSISSAA